MLSLHPQKKTQNREEELLILSHYSDRSRESSNYKVLCYHNKIIPINVNKWTKTWKKYSIGFWNKMLVENSWVEKELDYFFEYRIIIGLDSIVAE